MRKGWASSWLAERFGNKPEKASRSLDNRQLYQVFQNLHRLQSAGIAQSRALELLKPCMPQEPLRILRDQIQKGSSLAQALKASGVFTSFAWVMVQAGEQTGRLEPVFLHLAQYYEEALTFQKKMRSLLIYPAFIGVALLALGLFVLYYFIPAMGDLVGEQAGASVSRMHSIVAAASFWRQYGLAVCILTLSLASLILAGIGKWIDPQKKDQFLFVLPIIGPLLRWQVFYRLCYLLSMMLESGIGLLEAMPVLAQTEKILSVKKRIVWVSQALEEGKPLHEALQESKIVEPRLQELLLIAEETGEMPGTLAILADQYRQDSRERLERLSRYMEPVLILLVTGATAWLLFTIILPLLDIESVLQMQEAL